MIKVRMSGRLMCVVEIPDMIDEEVLVELMMRCDHTKD